MIETAVGPFTPETRMLIDGKLVEASSGKQFDNVNPATEAVLGQVADAGHEDMADAISAARRAFDETDWSTDRKFRQRCLLQLQEAIEAEREEMRAELVAEVGTPVMLTYSAQLDSPVEDGFRWPAQHIETFPWERSLPDLEAHGARSQRMVVKEPQGVIGAIIPWNFPFEITAHKLGPILATGNTVVVKPAPDTPWNATRIGRLIAEKTDIPAGVVNVVTSSDHLVGEGLTLDPRVDLISFTGSTATGKRIMERGASTLKRVFLELGGKSAMIVCDDADFDQVLPSAAIACAHGGQGCALQTRVLVPRSRYAEAVVGIKAALSAVKYGDPTDPTVFQGPQISAEQRDRVLSYIQMGIDEGATLALGGHRPESFPRGYFVEPTLFIDVDNSMTIAQEEIFGPVVVLIPFEDDDDAVRIANGNAYGLSGGVFSGSAERALSIARRVRTGSIAVNGGNWYAADSPYGGYKTSGIGRQGGQEGFETYLETKLIGIGT